QEQVGELEVTILDPVTPVVRRYWGIGLVVALLLIFLAEAIILRISWRSASSLSEANQNPPRQVVASYGPSELAYDLRVLQENTVNRTFVDRKVNFTGNESRIYKYAVSQLAPRACQSITALSLYSRVPSSGLLMTGTCLNRSEMPAVLEIVWKGRRASLYIDGHERAGNLDILVYPPDPAQLAAQEGQAKQAAQAAQAAALEEDQ
ncbi:MAG: hypothetical protein LBE80_09220, partial [Deltaproteobacteria bacterium]|nr:hypothetical protein [Deltaproteobacteria bacterium]